MCMYMHVYVCVCMCVCAYKAYCLVSWALMGLVGHLAEVCMYVCVCVCMNMSFAVLVR